MRKALVVACAASLLSGAAGYASPKAVVTLQHPPIAEWELGTVVLAPHQGDCGEQLTEKVLQMLGRHKTVAGPVDLRTLVWERKIQSPTFLAANDVKALGKQIGADTMLLIRTSKCTCPQSSFLESCRTMAELEGTVRQIDEKIASAMLNK